MEPFKPEQIFYLKKLICEALNCSDLSAENLVNSLPRYFCQNQIWHEKIRDSNTGAGFSAMVCLKYRAVCYAAIGNIANCRDYLSFEQVEKCESGVCKI